MIRHNNGTLTIEDCPAPVLAERFGTPLYVYSRAAIESAWRAYDQAFAAFDHQICYAVKANGSLAILQLLARLGSGFDIVSGGELARVLRAGGDPGKVVFSGVGKSEEEIEQGLAAGILAFNIESEAELERISAVAARTGRTAPVSLRVNPDVDARTHPYISTGLKENKFGIDIHAAEALYHRAAAMPGVAVSGMDFHIGSQLTELDPLADALSRSLALVDRLEAAGIHLEHLDIGGGLGIRYEDETPPSPAALAERLGPLLAGRRQKLLMEPGRALVGEAGLLLTRVEYLKPGHRDFAVVDAAMTDLLRPALYNAWQGIETAEPVDAEARLYDVVGPVCESADTLGRERSLALLPGTLLAIHATGAYGFVMASQYNARPRPAEVLVDGDRAHLIRERETLEALWQGEHLLDTP
ncbi:diaminopimelate decarboxylase [Spiribacter vilamensis]|uniref:Diaminopimelate decarboxylase n=1 Tax=Spiribacter vilamensis TaxID=531306 RepID=A0A4Q8D282_9GAMM|nr:diaminopimelate decarboxylase [Spiribacter vilamensis]RZU99496.1 diaminopimelate decarboxylase [Spiribacter vilamensis]TVO61531.1 diaminopimelate decarboxylase [Spiribacter vilamensis]